MLRYGHGAGGVHLTHFTANITGKEQRKLCKERMAKQREDAKRNVNNGLGFTDARTIRFRNKIKNLQVYIQQIKKNNRKKRSLKNEEKIKQKELQIKKLKEQLKEELNNAVKKISYHKKTDKKGNIIEEITDEYGYKRIKKNGHVVKIEKIPLEVAPTSNVFTKKYVPSFNKHPIRAFFDKGLMVTVNTDDPLFFKVSLLDEYWNLHKELKFSLEEIKQLILNSFDSTFLPDAEKKSWCDKVEKAWK